MADPFRSVALRGNIVRAGALALVAAFLIAGSLLHFGTVVTDGRLEMAKVLHLGTRPVASAAGGDLPILTVRLPDGSVRDVEGTWADVNDCKPGRWISIIQHGNAVQRRVVCNTECHVTGAVSSEIL